MNYQSAAAMAVIGAKIKAGGVLGFRDFCQWIGISHVTGYQLIADGKVKTSKLGRKRIITAANAIAFRDSLDGEMVA